MRFHFRFKKSLIGLVFDGREIDEIGLFELIANACSEFLEIIFADFLIIFGNEMILFGRGI